MHSFQVDPTRLVPLNRDPVADLCWMAREILGGHMEYVDDEPHDVEGEVEDDYVVLVEREDLMVHQTPTVPINDEWQVSLSNLPLIIGADGKFAPIEEPGYVALISDPIEMFQEDGPESDDKKAPGPKVGFNTPQQLIFSMPRPDEDGPDEPAAIYEGYELTERTQVAADDAPKLETIRMLLDCVRVGLRDMAEQDKDTYQGMHHSQAPVRSALNTLDEDLSTLLGY